MPRKKVPTPKVKCPDCDAEYPTPKGLSSHRRAAHGYVSQNKFAVYTRLSKERQKQPEIAALAPPLRTLLTCDQCGFEAKNVSSLTWHKARLHTPHKDLKCDLCGFVAKWPGGLTYHKRKTHAEANPTPEKVAKFNAKLRRPIVHSEKTQTIVVSAPATSNGHHPETYIAPDGISEASVAFTAGRVEELLHRVAAEYDVPARSFTARVIELVHAKTLWK